MTVLVDDHLLLALLTERASEELETLRRGQRIFTTGLWYHRLSRALSVPRVTEPIGARLGDLPAPGAERVIAASIELPTTVGLVSLRDLAWPMAELFAAHRLNLVTLEAVAAARHLKATIAIGKSDDGPRLNAAAAALEIPVRVVSL